MSTGHKPNPGHERTLVEDLVAYGVEDWVDELWIYANMARRLVEDSRDRRSIAIGLIAEVLFSGLMEAGSMQTEQDFVPWPDSPADALTKICSDWHQLETEPSRGQVVWLRNTEAGDAIGQQVLDRERLDTR